MSDAPSDALLEAAAKFIGRQEVARSLRPLRCHCGWKGFSVAAVPEWDGNVVKFKCPKCLVRVHRD